MHTINVRSHSGLAEDTVVTDLQGTEINNIREIRLSLMVGKNVRWSAEMEVYTGEGIEVRTAEVNRLLAKECDLRKVSLDGGELTLASDETIAQRINDLEEATKAQKEADLEAQKEAASKIWGANPPKSALEWVTLRWAAMWKKPRGMKMQCAVFVQADEAEVMASELERYALEIRERKYYQGSIGGRGLCGVYSYGPTDEEKESKEELIEDDDEDEGQNVIEIALTEEGLLAKAFDLIEKHEQAIKIGEKAMKYGHHRIERLAEKLAMNLYERLKSIDGCIREVQQHNDEKT